MEMQGFGFEGWVVKLLANSGRRVEQEQGIIKGGGQTPRELWEDGGAGAG